MAKDQRKRPMVLIGTSTWGAASYLPAPTSPRPNSQLRLGLAVGRTRARLAPLWPVTVWRRGKSFDAASWRRMELAQQVLKGRATPTYCAPCHPCDHPGGIGMTRMMSGPTLSEAPTRPRAQIVGGAARALCHGPATADPELQWRGPHHREEPILPHLPHPGVSRAKGARSTMLSILDQRGLPAPDVVVVGWDSNGVRPRFVEGASG